MRFSFRSLLPSFKDELSKVPPKYSILSENPRSKITILQNSRKKKAYIHPPVYSTSTVVSVWKSNCHFWHSKSNPKNSDTVTMSQGGQDTMVLALKVIRQPRLGTQSQHRRPRWPRIDIVDETCASWKWCPQVIGDLWRSPCSLPFFQISLFQRFGELPSMTRLNSSETKPTKTSAFYWPMLIPICISPCEQIKENILSHQEQGFIKGLPWNRGNIYFLNDCFNRIDSKSLLWQKWGEITPGHPIHLKFKTT